MTIRELTAAVEEFAPLSLQEKYDNAGLLVGSPDTDLTGVLICLDVTVKVIEEAAQLGCNLIIAHHPLIFNGLKRLTGQNEVQRCVVDAIKQNIAIYAAHTNLDNVLNGVNGKIAEKLGLKDCRILAPINDALCKVVTYVPKLMVQKVREAMFSAGAGNIGDYDSCSFNCEGYGSFKAGKNSNPFVGLIDKIHYEPEVRIEMIVPVVRKQKVIEAIKSVHPYEEPAFDIIPLLNSWEQTGAGIVGNLTEPISVNNFLANLKELFCIPCIRYTSPVSHQVQRIAVCGGSGSFLIKNAIAVHADVYITADIKYHDFMEADGKLMVVDAGHYETE